MSYYYPQASMTLRVLWEDFGEVQNQKLQDIYEISILARNITVNVNDYTQADTFSAEIDFKQFPFDPRAIRACGVKISIQNMPGIFQASNALEVIKPTRDNTIFQGFVDEESMSFDDTKRTVKMEGRDFTSLLLDRKYLDPKPIDLTIPIDQLIQNLLNDLKETQAIVVENRTNSDLSKITLAKFAPDFHPLGGTKNVKKDETYWEVIQDIVARAALIAFIELDKLVISKPRALYNANQAIKFVYGRNITNLTYKRKLGRKKNFNVVVRSLAPEAKGMPVIKAEIPLEATDQWSHDLNIPQKRIQIPMINPDGSKGADKDAPILSFLVPNVMEQKELIENGQQIYEELGRQQIEGSFETREMESRDGMQTCINLLSLRNGTPLKIEVSQGDLKGITKIVDPKATGDQKDKTIETTRRFLMARCYEPAIADALAATLNNPRFNSPFFTKGVQFTLDADNGFKIKVDFINFINLPPRLGGTG